jgi:hypothetical protein
MANRRILVLDWNVFGETIGRAKGTISMSAYATSGTEITIQFKSAIDLSRLS